MSWIGAAISLGGSLLQSEASKDASQQAAQGANNATNAQLQMFNTQNQQQEPYRQTGYTALNELLTGFGRQGTGEGYEYIGGGGVGGSRDSIYNRIYRQYDTSHKAKYGVPLASSSDAAGLASQMATINALADNEYARQQSGTNGIAGAASGSQYGVQPGYFAHQFDANDLKTNLAPNYQFQLDQGLGATRNALNLQGGFAGNTLKGINDYAQNFAGNAYQQAFNNYTANQSNIFNRLSTIAGLGSAANQQSAGLAGSLAPSIAGTIQNAGAAQAAGTIGAANALAGGGGNALGWYQYGNLMNGAQTGGVPLAQEMVPGQYSLGNPAYG